MRWFTSDLHLGHHNIIKFCDRPFKDVDHMREEIIRRWNDVVADDDEVWMLGDLCMGHGAETIPQLGRLNGHKVMVAGNHDKVFSANKPEYVDRWWPLYEEAGISIASTGPHLTLDLAPSRREVVKVNVCHFPYERDERHGSRYEDYLPPDDGRWLIHGHIHEAWKVRGRQINVGVDVWDFYPVAETTLLDIIEEAP